MSSHGESMGIGTYLKQPNTLIMTMYRKIMNQQNGTIIVTRDQFWDLLEVSKACYMLDFYDQLYKGNHDLYSKEMKETRIHFYFNHALDDEDEIELSHEKFRTIFNDTVLKISYFYPAYEHMTWKDMDMVKEIIDKFDILLLPKTNSKLELKKYSFASLCCVCLYLDYMFDGGRSSLQEIIQLARARKRSEEQYNGHFNATMKIHNNAKKLSFRLQIEREQCKDYEMWYNGLTGEEREIFLEHEEKEKRIDEELLELAEVAEYPYPQEFYDEDYEDDERYYRKRILQDYLDDLRELESEPEYEVFDPAAPWDYGQGRQYIRKQSYCYRRKSRR